MNELRVGRQPCCAVAVLVDGGGRAQLIWRRWSDTTGAPIGSGSQTDVSCEEVLGLLRELCYPFVSGTAVSPAPALSADPLVGHRELVCGCIINLGRGELAVPCQNHLYTQGGGR